MSIRRELELAGQGAYTFDVSPDGEPKLKRAAPMAEPEHSADELIAQLQRFDDDTERLIEQLRADRAEARKQLEHRAAEAMRRENKETDHATNED